MPESCLGIRLVSITALDCWWYLRYGPDNERPFVALDQHCQLFWTDNVDFYIDKAQHKITMPNVGGVMRKMSVVFALLASSAAFAADYSAELIGKYVDLQNNNKNACQDPQLVIEKSMRYNDVGAACVATKITVQKVSADLTNYVVNEKCEREDAKWTQVSTYQPGGLMLVTEKAKGRDSMLRLKRCY